MAEHQNSSYFQMVQEANILVQYLQLFCKFEHISKLKKKNSTKRSAGVLISNHDPNTVHILFKFF